MSGEQDMRRGTPSTKRRSGKARRRKARAAPGAIPEQGGEPVDELGRALGVEQESDAEVRTSDEILRTRDRHYWHLERRAAADDDSAR